MILDYDSMYERNYGIFTKDEQSRIRKTRIVIIGDSGTGETISTILARCGIEQFIIAGKDVYLSSDMNRQATCFIDTVGKRKVEVIRDTILSINPGANVTPYQALPTEEEVNALILQGDIVIPAVEDFAFSVLLFRTARKQGKPAILCLPSGSMGWVSVFRDGTPSLDDVFGVPNLGYKDLLSIVHTKEFRCGQYHYITSGDWRVDWFLQYFEGNLPLPLICPVEWMVASLAALEILKLASRKWQPMLAPRCWYLRKGKVSTSRFSWFLKYHRKIGWLVFGTDQGRRLHKLTPIFWKKFFAYLRSRE